MRSTTHAVRGAGGDLTRKIEDSIGEIALAVRQTLVVLLAARWHRRLKLNS